VHNPQKGRDRIGKELRNVIYVTIHNPGSIWNDPEAISYGSKNPFWTFLDASVGYASGLRIQRQSYVFDCLAQIRVKPGTQHTYGKGRDRIRRRFCNVIYM
jgi:hypothetical protein